MQSLHFNPDPAWGFRVRALHVFSLHSAFENPQEPVTAHTAESKLHFVTAGQTV